jgi:hypothetical protein
MSKLNVHSIKVPDPVIRYTVAPKRPYANAQYSVRSSELAINDDDDKQDKDGYDCNGDDAVRGHATRFVSMHVKEVKTASNYVAVSTGADMCGLGTAYRRAIPFSVLMLRSV